MPTTQNSEYNNQVPSTPSSTRLDPQARRERDEDQDQMLTSEINSDISAQAIPLATDETTGPENPLAAQPASSGQKSTFPSTDLLETSNGFDSRQGKQDTIA